MSIGTLNMHLSMNKNYERLAWISLIVLGVFTIQNQANTNTDLNTLIETYHAETQIQKSAIMDFNNQLHSTRDSSYMRGFEAGKTQAGIALAQGDSLYGYTEGYHAAVSQFSPTIDSDSTKAAMLGDLLIYFIDHEMSAEDSYWELLKYMSEDPPLNANAESPNK